MNKRDISLILADDHPMILKGLNEELIANNYTVLGQAKNGMQALELILELSPTIALLDIDMPLLTGLEVIKMAKEKGVTTKFIVLSFHKEKEYLTQAKSLQIDGYLLKEDGFFEIERCIEAVLKNEQYFSSSFDITVLENAGSDIKNINKLTPSELTILKIIAKGCSNTELANTLGVSIRTIEKHRSNIINKLEITGGTNALTVWALTNKGVIRDL